MNWENRDYQEIINTADCNAEVNFTGANGELRIMGWARKLIDTAWEARQKEVDEAEQRGVKKVVDEIARLALVSDDTTLKSYVVGLLAQVRSKYPKPLPSEGEK
jgi:hypothetical protein